MNNEQISRLQKEVESLAEFVLVLRDQISGLAPKERPRCEITREEEMQAYSDTLAALAIAIARQIDASQLTTDLKHLAHQAENRGNGPSAGLLDELARTIDEVVTGRKKH